MARLEGKEMDVATDTTKHLLERFRAIRQAWDLQQGEAETLAQNRALLPLHEWLRRGVDLPEVVVRAVQVLMADSERPAIHKRPAINEVIQAISDVWASAGLKPQDTLILRGMILAAWPEDLAAGGFEFAPLLDSAWMALKSKTNKEMWTETWRQRLATGIQPNVAEKPLETSANATQASRNEVGEVPDLNKIISDIDNVEGVISGQWGNPHGVRMGRVLRAHHSTLGVLVNQANAFRDVLDETRTDLSNLSDQVSETLSSPAPQIHLLWWGQAKYSHLTRRPYRRITDPIERVWWMAWECSELALGLEVEPVESFLVETLHQFDTGKEDRKRPLWEWVSELVSVLRSLHGKDPYRQAMVMSTRLKTLSSKDPLGLPITWARLEASGATTPEGTLEERFREQVALDPEAPIAQSDWAAWIFREAMLDRRFQNFGGQ